MRSPHRSLRVAVAALAVSCTLAVAPRAAMADNPHPTLGEISTEVMCPTCDTTLDRSNSPAADRMRVYINRWIAQGWSEQQILNGLVKEYGGDETILADPPGRGRTAVIWIAPAVAGALALLVGAITIMRWRRRGQRAVTDAA